MQVYQLTLNITRSTVFHICPTRAQGRKFHSVSLYDWPFRRYFFLFCHWLKSLCSLSTFFDFFFNFKCQNSKKQPLYKLSKIVAVEKFGWIKILSVEKQHFENRIFEKNHRMTPKSPYAARPNLPHMLLNFALR